MNGKPNTEDKRPIIIKNRDIPILQRVVFVMQDIRALEERREWQKSRLNNISQHLSGMPRGGSGPVGLDAAFAALDELEEEHKELVKEYYRELKAAQRIINGIRNRFMRTFVTMMYVENIQSGKVRSELNMTERGFRSAREAVEQSPDMANIVWHDRYILEKSQDTK